MNRINSKKINTWIIGGLLSIVAITFLYPFLWVLISSFKTTQEIYESSFALPKSFNFNNYIVAWTKAKIGRYFFNSLFICLVALLLTLSMSITSAYTLIRVFPNKLKWLNIYIAIGLLIPLQSISIPVFVIFKNLHLLNNYISIILIYAVSGFPLAFFIMTGFLKTLPKELDEASYIDGCSLFQSFWYVILPLIKPAIASVSILSFLSFWNEYFFASVLITNNDYKTLTQGLMNLKGVYTIDYAVMMGGLSISIIPVIVFYVLFQKQVQESITAGAVKG